MQYLLGDWLKKKCMANNVWWALNPGSDDTGGLLAVRALGGFACCVWLGVWAVA